MQIRIIKSNHPDNWYNEMVGQVLESLNESDHNGLYVINPEDKHSKYYYIYHGDYEKLSFEHLTELIGKEICDYCNGYFGREFLTKKIVAMGDRWIVAEIPQDNNRLVFADFKDFDDMKHWLKEWGVLE
jgi:hypothetical protein